VRPASSELSEPVPLVLAGDATAALLREALGQDEVELDGVQAWLRAIGRPAPRARRRWWWLALALAPVAIALVVATARPPRDRVSRAAASRPTAFHPTVEPLPASLPVAKAPEPVARRKHPLVPRRLAQLLAPGAESALADGSRLRLSAGGVATVSAPTPSSTSVVLERGTVGLAVVPRRPGHGFEVRAGSYQFRVVGTRFVVSLAGGEVELFVSEGAVAVMTGGVERERIGAGERWRSGDAPRAPADEAGRLPARRDGQDCRELARRGAARQAAACYEIAAAGDDLHAEVALYELARLQRDALADPRAALSTLARYRARFPHGNLGEEVMDDTLGLVVRTGDASAALSLSELLLERAPSAERRAQLHLVRGNVRRVLERDYPRALVEYARAESEGTGALADEGLFWRAVCLQEIAERDQARSAFTRYLQRSRAPRAAEARARLEELKP
jgi:hypothetical protein